MSFSKVGSRPVAASGLRGHSGGLDGLSFFIMVLLPSPGGVLSPPRLALFSVLSFNLLFSNPPTPEEPQFGPLYIDRRSERPFSSTQPPFFLIAFYPLSHFSIFLGFFSPLVCVRKRSSRESIGPSRFVDRTSSAVLPWHQFLFPCIKTLFILPF